MTALLLAAFVAALLAWPEAPRPTRYQLRLARCVDARAPKAEAGEEVQP